MPLLDVKISDGCEQLCENAQEEYGLVIVAATRAK